MFYVWIRYIVKYGLWSFLYKPGLLFRLFPGCCWKNCVLVKRVMTETQPLFWCQPNIGNNKVTLSWGQYWTVLLLYSAKAHFIVPTGTIQNTTGMNLQSRANSMPITLTAVSYQQLYVIFLSRIKVEIYILYGCCLMCIFNITFNMRLIKCKLSFFGGWQITDSLMP